jgi:hypothetical protein
MPGTETLFVMEVFVVLVAAATLVALATRRLTILPYSVALVILGVAVSAFQLPIDLEIAPEVLLAVLIPGLIFDAAYRIDLRDLMPNLPAIAILATVGVLVTAVTVGLTLGLRKTGMGATRAVELAAPHRAGRDSAERSPWRSHCRCPRTSRSGTCCRGRCSDACSSRS